MRAERSAGSSARRSSPRTTSSAGRARRAGAAARARRPRETSRSPSRVRSPYALLTVFLLTWSCSPRCRADGSGEPGFHVPARRAVRTALRTLSTEPMVYLPSVLGWHTVSTRPRRVNREAHGMGGPGGRPARRLDGLGCCSTTSGAQRSGTSSGRASRVSSRSSAPARRPGQCTAAMRSWPRANSGRWVRHSRRPRNGRRNGFTQ